MFRVSVIPSCVRAKTRQWTVTRGHSGHRRATTDREGHAHSIVCSERRVLSLSVASRTSFRCNVIAAHCEIEQRSGEAHVDNVAVLVAIGAGLASQSVVDIVTRSSPARQHTCRHSLDSGQCVTLVLACGVAEGVEGVRAHREPARAWHFSSGIDTRNGRSTSISASQSHPDVASFAKTIC